MTYNVKTKTNISYGSSSFQRFDSWIPNGRGLPAKLDTIVFITGGAFAAMDGNGRQQWNADATRLAGLGFACFSIGYRGYPKNYYNDTLADIRAAIAAVKVQSVVDPSSVCAWGHSAGAFMAAWMSIEKRVKVAICEACPADITDTPTAQTVAWLHGVNTQVASPVYHWAADSKPTMFVHGTADGTVPYSESSRSYDALKALGVPTFLRPHAGDHAPINYKSATGKAIRDDQLAFLKLYL